MLVKLMLPISIVEQEGFKEFIMSLDPQFSVPTRYSVKTSGLSFLSDLVNKKLKEIINKCRTVNISNDGWTDATIRCLNGYIVQAIDDDWNCIFCQSHFDNHSAVIILSL